MKMLTTQEAAERLGVTDGRVRAMILSGKLPAARFGRAHLIREGDLKLVEDRKPGRPPKTSEPKGKTAPARKKNASK